MSRALWTVATLGGFAVFLVELEWFTQWIGR